MHTDLQFEVIPDLIEMFPRVQFILSTHSPLVALGLERKFGTDQFVIIDMPSGEIIDAERFAEFRRAVNVMRQTAAFQSAIAEEAKSSQRNLVLLEGETDPLYFNCALDLFLTKGDLTDKQRQILSSVDFEWVGAKQDAVGRNTFSGKDSLNQAFSFLKANPGFVNRKILFLYDCDAKKPPLDSGDLHIRTVESNKLNDMVMIGVENLLPKSIFTDEMFDINRKMEPSGKSVEIRELNKMRLCKSVCNRAEYAVLEGFKSTIVQIADLFS